MTSEQGQGIAPPARRRRGDVTRRIILSAAATEFATKGFEGASMRSIARSLGIELGLIQHHFGDKTSLWASVLGEVIGGYRREFEQLVDDNGGLPPAQLIALLIESLVRYAAEHDTFVALMSQARTSSSAHALAYQQEINASTLRWIELISAAQAEGRFVQGRPGLLFYQMVGAALRIFATAADARDLIGLHPSDPQSIAEHVRSCVGLFMPYAVSDTAGDAPAAPLVPQPAVSAAMGAPRPSTFYMINHIDGVIRRSLDEELKEIGITQSQMMALIRIADEHKLSSARLARMLDISAQSVTIFVRALEAQGLIRRAQAKHSKRILAIDVTPNGFKVLDRLREIVAQAEAHLLEGLSPEERYALKEMLERILKRHRPLSLSEWSPLLAARTTLGA